MTRAIRYEQLGLEELTLLNGIIDHFEAALMIGDVVRAEDHLERLPESLRDALLEELLLLECEYQLRTSGCVDYINLYSRFPNRIAFIQSAIERAVMYHHAGSSVPTVPLAEGHLPTAIGRFQVRRLLGVGGFGTVYLAFDPPLNLDVALKVAHPHVAMDPKSAGRLTVEAKRLARMDHPQSRSGLRNWLHGRSAILGVCLCAGTDSGTMAAESARSRAVDPVGGRGPPDP
jgi:eukaryotic-like serine/threonine-protein kinase